MVTKNEIACDAWPVAIQKLGCEVLLRIAKAQGEHDGWPSVLSLCASAMQADVVAIVDQVAKSWVVLANNSGNAKLAISEVPEDLIASAQRGQMSAEDVWVGSVLNCEGSSSRLLVKGCGLGDDQRSAAFNGLVQIVSCLAEFFAGRQTLESRCARQAAMLQIAANWQQELDSNELLESIAAASTELVGSERASIFLWDRRRGVLLGRPALGVEGGQLEVDDSAGVVGAVLKSGQPKRWDASDDESEVNRKVDKKLEFETRSLLAVPLINSRGKTIGVFELINKIDGVFTSEDEATLVELAIQAAAAIENTREKEQLVKTCDDLAKEVSGHARIIGQSPEIVEVRETAMRIAETNLAVLILGKNGTGKEVLARTIHFNSPRKREPFVAVNCAALVESLLESELFGHEKGAFTDAHDTRQGKFEVASGGTLFLDEIGDMSLAGQAKLLRVLEEKVIVRVGGSTPIPIDVRIVAATNQPLAELVSEKRFREDLYFRLNVVTLDLPSLSRRGDDILLLAEHFLDVFANQIGRKKPNFDASAKNALLAHPWPGNIRELRNLIERVAYLCNTPTIRATDLSFSASPSQPGNSGNLSALPLNEATRQFQIDHIQSTIDQLGNMTEAAKRLGLHRSNLYRKMKQLDMDVND